MYKLGETSVLVRDKTSFGRPMWVISDGPWMYGPSRSLLVVLYQFFFERDSDKHLVM